MTTDLPSALTEQEFVDAWRECHLSADEHGHVTQEAAESFDRKVGTWQLGTVSLLHSVKSDHFMKVEDNYHLAWERYLGMRMDA